MVLYLACASHCLPENELWLCARLGTGNNVVLEVVFGYAAVGGQVFLRYLQRGAETHVASLCYPCYHAALGELCEVGAVVAGVD